MDIKNIIKNLHPLEIKVLLKYSQKDELTSEKLQKELDYKEGHANQAFSWLGGKELIKEIRRTPHTFFEITDMGKALAEAGTVEERVISYLKDNGAHTLPEIAAAIGVEQKDIGSAFGPLSKEGVLKMNAEKKAEYTGAAVPARITMAGNVMKKGAAKADGMLNKDDLSAEILKSAGVKSKKKAEKLKLDEFLEQSWEQIFAVIAPEIQENKVENKYYSDGTALKIMKNGLITRINYLSNGNYGINESGVLDPNAELLDVTIAKNAIAKAIEFSAKSAMRTLFFAIFLFMAYLIRDAMFSSSSKETFFLSSCTAERFLYSSVQCFHISLTVS